MFIIRSTYDSDLPRADISLMIIVSFIMNVSDLTILQVNHT